MHPVLIQKAGIVIVSAKYIYHLKFAVNLQLSQCN